MPSREGGERHFNGDRSYDSVGDLEVADLVESYYARNAAKLHPAERALLAETVKVIRYRFVNDESPLSRAERGSE